MIKRMRFLFAFGFLALFCSCAFYVNNVSAFSLDVQVTPKTTINVNYWYCRFKEQGDGRECGGLYGNSGPFQFSRFEIQDLYTTDTYNVTEGNYYEVRFSILGLTDEAQPMGVLWQARNNDNFDVVSVETVVDDRNLSGWNTSSTGTANAQLYYNTQNVTYLITLRSKVTGSYPFVIGNSRSTLIYQNELKDVRYFTYPSVVEFEPTNDASQEMNDKDNQDREDLENQSSDTQSSSDDSQQEAESTGTTLLSAFTSFVGALSSASPSNCRINMDLGNFDMGNVDLCSLSPPPEFQSIASIMLILFCVPLSIATARKVISLFRSFQ